MKKKILSQLFIVSFAFAGLFLVVQNVKADPVSPPGDHGIPNCPGGSCTFYDANFNTTCTACCSSLDRPVCNTYGCECKERF